MALAVGMFSSSFRMTVGIINLLLLLLPLPLPCDSGTFWHISDLHMDYTYVAGGNRTNMCRAWTKNSTTATNSSSISSKQTNVSTVGPAGDYGCDAPYQLVMSALEAMQRIEPRPDFIVWTGDSVPHWRDPAPPSEEYILNVTKTIFTRLESLFPGVPLVPALGNHDADPPHQMPIPTPQKKSPEYYLKLWHEGGFGAHSEDTFKSCGFYSKVLNGTKLRFVVLNTNIYYSDNFTEGPDPCGQLAWLDAVLRNSTESVIIAAHVSPGSYERGSYNGSFYLNFNKPDDYYDAINKKYVQIVSKASHAKKIVCHLYGHLHTDTFRVIFDRATAKEPRGVAFLAGAVTPLIDHNPNHTVFISGDPNIRLFNYTDTSLQLMDYAEYTIDLSTVEEGSRDNKAGQSKKKALDDTDDRLRRTKRDAQNVVSSPLPAVPGLSTQSPDAEAQQTNKQTNIATIESSSDGNNATADNSTTAKDLDHGESEAKPENVSTTTVAGADNDEAEITKLASGWKLLYRASESFQVPDLSPLSMFTAVKRMVEEGVSGQMFQEYYRHNTAGHDNKETCGERCWRGQLCTITNLDMAKLTRCLASNDTSGFYYKSPYNSNNKKSKLKTTTTTVTRTGAESTTATTSYTTTPLRWTAAATTITTQKQQQQQEEGGVGPTSVEIKVITGQPPLKDVEIKKMDTSYVTARAVSIFFGVLGVVVCILLAVFGYKKYRESRFRSQEFLLTDSVFRYDGYSQLDDD